MTAIMGSRTRRWSYLKMDVNLSKFKHCIKPQIEIIMCISTLLVCIKAPSVFNVVCEPGL